MGRAAAPRDGRPRRHGPARGRPRSRRCWPTSGRARRSPSSWRSTRSCSGSPWMHGPPVVGCVRPRSRSPCCTARASSPRPHPASPTPSTSSAPARSSPARSRKRRGDEWAPPHLPYVPAHGRPVARGRHQRRSTRSAASRPGSPTTASSRSWACTGSSPSRKPYAPRLPALWSPRCWSPAMPGELASLARLVVADVCRCSGRRSRDAASPASRWCTTTRGAVAAAAGERAVSDATEAAVRVTKGRIVARADGRGACHAVAR